MKFIFVILLFVFTLSLYSQTTTNSETIVDTFQIKQAIISNGGIVSSNNSNYRISASAGQMGIDSIGNSQNSIYFGFWYLYPQYIISSLTFDDELLPKKFDLKQNYPNPFNPATTIEYAVPKAGQITIEVYNILGQKVMVLVNEKHNPGVYKIKWNGFNAVGNSVSNGIYFYRMIAQSADGNVFGKTRKMMFLK